MGQTTEANSRTYLTREYYIVVVVLIFQYVLKILALYKYKMYLFALFITKLQFWEETFEFRKKIISVTVLS